MVKLVKFIPKHDEQSELHVNPTSVSCIFKDNESDEVAEDSLITEEESEADEAISADEASSETTEGLFFDRPARNILIGIIIAYLLAMIIGFVLGLFGY